VGVVYRSPSAPCGLDSESNLAAMLIHVMFNFASYDFVLWGTLTFLKSNGLMGLVFVLEILLSSLSQTISEPTRFREGQVSNTFDLVILSNPDLIKNEITTLIGNSTHVVIVSEICLPTKQPFFKHQKYYKLVSKRLANVNWEQFITINIEEKCSNVKTVISHVGKSCTRIFWVKQVS